MEIIRHTSLGKMVPCRSAQCNHSYCVSCSTTVLVILVILIVLLTATVETGVWGRGRLGGVGVWVGCEYVHTVCAWTYFLCIHGYVCACMHVCACVHSCMCTLVWICASLYSMVYIKKNATNVPRQHWLARCRVHHAYPSVCAIL